MTFTADRVFVELTTTIPPEVVSRAAEAGGGLRSGRGGFRFNLASMIRRPSRRPVVFRPIQSTQAQADSLAAIYRRVIEPWVKGRDRISAAYERTLSEMQLDSADDIRAAIDDIAEEIRRLVLELTPDLRDWAFRVERVHRGKWIRSILSAVDVALDTVLSADDVSDTLEAQINWNVGLVRDVSEEQRRRISNAVFSGLQQRKPAREVAKEIREATGMARARSIRIAGDQTSKLGARLNEARQRQAGFDRYVWMHSRKAHPRPHHQARDGKVFPWEGEGSVPRGDRPSEPPFCGCTARAYLSFDDEK